MQQPRAILPPVPHPGFSISVSEGDVFFDVDGTRHRVTAATSRTFVRYVVGEKTLTLFADDGSRIKTALSGDHPLDRHVGTILYSDMYGQSNGSGQGAGEATTIAPFEPRFLMFGAGQRTFGNAVGHSQGRNSRHDAPPSAIRDFVAGHESQMGRAGETASSSFAAMLVRDGALAADSAIVTTCSAVGSANQEFLWKRAHAPLVPDGELGLPWANLERKFVRAALFWRMKGLRFAAGPLRINQGEGNFKIHPERHLTGLRIFQKDWQALAAEWNAVSDLGFAGQVPIVVAQTCSGARYGFPRSKLPGLQLRANIDDPTTALCIGPLYDQIYAKDGGHILAAGQIMQGARQAVAYGEWLKGRRWHPLCVREDDGFAPERRGSRVILRLWNHFDLPLVFDTRTVTGLAADQGFAWYDPDDRDEVRVVGAEIVDRTTIALTLSAVPVGSGGFVEIGMNGALRGSAGPSTGNRSTLRTDGAVARTPDGRPVEHFVCIDRVPVVVRA